MLMHMPCSTGVFWLYLISGHIHGLPGNTTKAQKQADCIGQEDGSLLPWSTGENLVEQALKILMV